MKRNSKYLLGAALVLTVILLAFIYTLLGNHLERRQINKAVDKWQAQSNDCEKDMLDWTSYEDNFKTTHSIPIETVGGVSKPRYSNKFSECFVEVFYIYSRPNHETNEAEKFYEWFLILTNGMELVSHSIADKTSEATTRLQWNSIISDVEAGDNQLLKQGRQLQEDDLFSYPTE